jgi:hypothetical protein
MGKKHRRSHRLADRDAAFDFYQRLEEAELDSWDDDGPQVGKPRAQRRGARSQPEPFGEGRRRRNRRPAGRRSKDPRRGPSERWDEAG